MIQLDQEIYKENILDHYKNPRNFEGMLMCSVVQKDTNPLCGDKIEMYAQISDAGMLEKLTFKGSGCAISLAAASMLTEMLPGKPTNDIQQMGQKEIVDMLGISIGIARMKCAMLGLRTLQKGLVTYQLTHSASLN